MITNPVRPDLFPVVPNVCLVEQGVSDFLFLSFSSFDLFFMEFIGQRWDFLFHVSKIVIVSTVPQEFCTSIPTMFSSFTAVRLDALYIER